MTKDEIVAKKNESLQSIQQGLGMIESLKGQVAAHRGKVLVYDELLDGLEGATDTEIPPLKAVKDDKAKGGEAKA